MIRFQGVTKRFPGGGPPALDGVDLEVPDGEMLGLVGRNGAGKSTLLRIGAGLLRPSEGHVEIDGHDLRTDPVGARRPLGWVPEAARFVPTESPSRLLEHLARLDGHRPTEAARLAADALARVELATERDRPVRTLSQGQARRLSLAAAWLERPSHLLYDEATNGLDPAGRRLWEESFPELRARRGCGILASHRLEELEAWCDRIAVLAGGRLVAVLPNRTGEGRVRLRIGVETPAEPRLEELRQLGAVSVAGARVTVTTVGENDRDVVAELTARGFRVREVRSVRDDVAKWLDPELP